MARHFHAHHHPHHLAGPLDLSDPTRPEVLYALWLGALQGGRPESIVRALAAMFEARNRADLARIQGSALIRQDLPDLASGLPLRAYPAESAPLIQILAPGTYAPFVRRGIAALDRTRGEWWHVAVPGGHDGYVRAVEPNGRSNFWW